MTVSSPNNAHVGTLANFSSGTRVSNNCQRRHEVVAIAKNALKHKKEETTYSIEGGKIDLVRYSFFFSSQAVVWALALDSQSLARGIVPMLCLAMQVAYICYVVKSVNK